ncbi:MAG: hypothetical protein JXR78_09780 [Victivallales bacterium]|nr:hypothetical protein [Victivallales bacterium]
MGVELSYILMTPYTVMKSRTGGILSRLLSRTDLELVGARIISFDEELCQQYATSIEKTVAKRDSRDGAVLADYIRENFAPFDGKNERAVLLLFRGENACEKLFSVVGNFVRSDSKKSFACGETIRDTYADYVIDKTTGQVKYFEPAVLTPPSREDADCKLKMFSEYMDRTSNIVENVIGSSEKDERTLVIIKPDNWRHPSTKPGGIVDMISRTGLKIVGCKLFRMSVAEALEFYAPVKNALREKVAPAIGRKARELIEKEFNIILHEKNDDKLTELAGYSYADDQFSQIIEFMSGVRPENCPAFELNDKGKAKCLVLIYQGIDAINKIRQVLGPTDPTKAPGGTVRRDFGSNIMINTAHASDSKENVEREMNIVKINRNSISDIIKEYLIEQQNNPQGNNS